jgi:hypothetical protein
VELQMMSYVELISGGAYILFAVLAWTMKEKSDELHRISVLLNRTREEIARDYATNQDVDKVTQHIDQRFDRLEERLLTVLTSVQTRNNNGNQ